MLMFSAYNFVGSVITIHMKLSLIQYRASANIKNFVLSSFARNYYPVGKIWSNVYL